VVEQIHIFFERAVDASGLRYWTNELLHHSDAWMAKRLLLSDEGWRRSQVVYGGKSTPMPPPCPKPWSVWPPSPRTIYSLGDHPASGRLIALTFDDGPNPTWTPQILDVLASRGVKATFFVVGEYAQVYPDLIRRELAEGHRVASHTWSHADLTRLSVSDARNQIQSTVNLVNSIAGGKAVSCVRPPYGAHNATTDQIASDLGLSTVIWSRDSQDYLRPGVPAIIANSLSMTYDGGRGIDGMHDGGGDRSQTVAALGPLIDNLRAQGYRFVTIC
jgi:peptidoglycan/xylan/chitin deacetylase (PgdA/CDA1 family)